MNTKNSYILFELENLNMKKENEIFNLENILKFLKNNKNKNLSLPAENYVNIQGEIKPYALFNNYHILNNDQQYNLYDNKEDELAIKSIIQDDLEYTRNSYQSVTKKAIAEKNLYTKNISKIEELKKEISNLKNPPAESECGLTSKNNLTTAPRTSLSQIKPAENLESFKKNDLILKELEEELLKSKNTRNEFSGKIEVQKKVNEKLDKEVSALNNELSDKFSLIFQLETKLEKLKKKKQKQVEG